MKDPSDFHTALELYNNSKKKARGRKKHSTILLDYRCWIIEVDDCFPNFNYIVRKKNDTHFHHVAYCGSLESALKTIYDIMFLDVVNRQNNYGGKFEELRNAILETKKQFAALLDVTPIIQSRIKRGDNKNV